MKVIKYKVIGHMVVWNPEAEEMSHEECLVGIECPYTEEAYHKAIVEAYNGEIIVEEIPDQEPEPAGDDVWAELDSAYQEGVNAAYDQ